MESAGKLAEGRKCFDRQAWGQAYDALKSADDADPLSPADLELLATTAYMLGHEAEYRELLDRAYNGWLEAGEPLAATRSACWITVSLAAGVSSGKPAAGSAVRSGSSSGEGGDTVERGYLLLPRIFEQEAAGDLEESAATSGEAAEIGERFRDPDLFSIATHAEGSVLIRLGRLREGLALLDLAMVAVVAGEVSPISSGIVYCGVILACEDAHELRRAREWTNALTQWCEGQPDLVSFTGRCLVHRARSCG